MKPISLQLYTVREAAAADGFPEVLRRVAEIGYTGVELAGLHGHTPAEIAMIVKDLGMEISGSHTELPTLQNFQRIVHTELALGNSKIIPGLGPDYFKTVDRCKEAAKKFNTALRLIGPYGLKLGMHNHWWEFEKVGGRYAYDIFMEECPEVFGEMDVYWTAYAGVDPVEQVARFKARLPLLHIKDGTLQKDAPQTAVGSGVLDIPAIIAAADPNVVEWIVVELDECATDMFDAVRQSYDYLVANGLARGNR